MEGIELALDEFFLLEMTKFSPQRLESISARRERDLLTLGMLQGDT